MDPAGYGLTQAGKIIGLIMTILAGVITAAMVLHLLGRMR